MQNTVQTIPAAFIEPKPAVVEDRTVTYPLRSGGFLAVDCPAWCTADHADDIERGIDPVDLQHTGAPISLGFDDVDGERETILEARLVQWPFDPDGDTKPHIDLTPEASSGESLICRNRIELDEQIRRVRAHLNELIRLGDRLAQAQADDHAERAAARGTGKPWLSLSRTDVQSMPIAYLLKAFGVRAVETEDIGRKAVLALVGEPGAMELRMLPDLPQQLREDQTRRALLAWHDAQTSSRG
ncbi:DUF6907 domain-containing protein [Streptomyces incanus]|uniref:DUF6907 domain-containing protein n=1 Tax=Streptomyces incanus TaxID=887453 RepID=A0ABW0XLX7_9ACTN